MKTAVTFGILAACAVGYAQVIPTNLYAPARSIKDQKITLQGWGSGTISETDQIAYDGTTSIRVSSRNFFQGGTMQLGQPVDLAKKFDDKSNLLEVTFFLEDAGWVYGVTDKNAIKGAGEGGLIGKGGGATMLNPGKGGNTLVHRSVPFLPKIDSVRLIITTTDDKKSEVYVPVGTSQSAANALGWRSISVPLQAINGFDRTNKIVKGISVSTDTVATMYIGAINVQTDQTPIIGEIQNVQSMNLALGDEVKLSARGEGGSSVLVYDWDFDDTDGIQVDAEGLQTTHKFRKAGKYKVTLTISDLYGLKKPFVTSFPVVVNP